MIAGLALLVGFAYVGYRGYQIGTDIFGRVQTKVCDYKLPFGLGDVCGTEETTYTCEGGEFDSEGKCVITPIVVVDKPAIIANCNPLDACFASGQEKIECYHTDVEFDDKGNSICKCMYSNQCESDILRLECESQSFDKYWSNGQCKTKPTTETIDDTTGLKVQDILEDKFIEDGGDLQKCKDNDGQVVGQYFSSHKLADVVTTCVPKITEVEILKPTYEEIQSKCQTYCNENDFDIGSVERGLGHSNYCNCDGVPQIHLSILMNTSTTEIDYALR